MSFSWFNDVKIYTNSLKRWDIPYGEELSPFDYQKILNRLVRYFSCWGGAVSLSNAPLQDMDDIKNSLQEAGIAFEEVEGIVHYVSTVEEEKKRKGGVFDR